MSYRDDKSKSSEYEEVLGIRCEDVSYVSEVMRIEAIDHAIKKISVPSSCQDSIILGGDVSKMNEMEDYRHTSLDVRGDLIENDVCEMSSLIFEDEIGSSGVDLDECHLESYKNLSSLDNCLVVESHVIDVDFPLTRFIDKKQSRNDKKKINV